jgi:hypothetical protein
VVEWYRHRLPPKRLELGVARSIPAGYTVVDLRIKFSEISSFEFFFNFLKFSLLKFLELNFLKFSLTYLCIHMFDSSNICIHMLHTYSNEYLHMYTYAYVYFADHVQNLYVRTTNSVLHFLKLNRCFSKAKHF